MSTDKANLITQQAMRDLEAAAGKLATEMEGSEEFTKLIESYMEINRQNKMSTADIHFSLLEMFDEEAIASWPPVGSEKKDVGENEAFDRFDYKDTNGTVREGSYWRMVAKSHAIGAGILGKVKEVDERGSVKNEYTGLSDGDAKRRKEDLNGDFEWFLTKLKLAVAAYFWMKDVEARYPNVVVDYSRIPVYDTKGNVTFIKDAKTGKPTKDIETKIDMSSHKIICVKKTGQPDISRYFSITGALRLDIDKALKDGGSYEDFITSNATGTEDDENPDEEKHIVVDGPKSFEDGSIAYVTYLNKVRQSKLLFKDLRAYYAKGDDHRLKTLFDMAELLTVLTEDKELKDRADAIELGTDTPAAAAAKLKAVA